MSFDETPRCFPVEPYDFDRWRRYTAWTVSNKCMIVRLGASSPFASMPPGFGVVVRSQIIRLHPVKDKTSGGLVPMGTQLRVKQSLSEVGRSSFRLTYQVDLDDGGDQWAPVAENETVGVSISNGKTVPFPLPLKPSTSAAGPARGSDLSRLFRSKLSELEELKTEEVHSFPVYTRTSDEDNLGHIHHSNYFKFFTDALASRDVQLNREPSQVSVIGLDYVTEGKRDQQMTIQVLLSPRRSSSTQEELYMILLNPDGKVVNRCWMEAALASDCASAAPRL
eukprot:CAMPEP_0184553740 /NCGR_PEP_ID=MMETSP0199_2-20130426/33104_1 /TAXON_ID=1112570 /ORGANISM="Thraustochytrium sp., Strain LLF1b" /LENGTH=279 /DNA_ID=CAMNT_0026949585 /DNA_START=15 /DNA_END=854 /DNA_ORIENTATION=-